MNVLFVYTNINGTHEDTYSFGLASLVSITKNRGYSVQVSIVENESHYPKFIQTLKQFRPNVIAFTAVSSQFVYIKELSKQIKSCFPEAIIVCGGVHMTLFPEALVDVPSLDGAFRGESELSFIEFLNKIEAGLDYKDTDNFCYLNGDEIISNPLKPLILDLDSLPFPDKISYPYNKTVEIHGIAPFMFSRGCPFHCSYCCNQALGNIYGLSRNLPRYRSPESSIREIEETLRLFPYVNTVYLLDDTFGLDKKWREEFCVKYSERVKIKFICLLRVNIVDEEFVRLLKQAGCYRISFGVESGNDYVRNTIMNRNIAKEQIINAFNLAQKYGIETNAINIIGVPGETEDMLWDTINFNRLLQPTSSGVNIFYPYKGTKLGNHCFLEGLVDEEMYESFSFERRGTILNYSEDYKRKLEKYHQDWQILVYPFDPIRRIKWILMKNPQIWEIGRKIKQKVFPKNSM